MRELDLDLRHWALELDAGGRNVWRAVISRRTVPAERAAVIVCDMWDAHWSRGASERVEAMAPQMNEVLLAARAQGVHIVHAPSDTLDFYAGTRARERALGAPRVAPPPLAEHPDPPLPIDDSDHGSDTGEAKVHYPWTRQHEAIGIDQGRDVVSADGGEIYSLLRLWNVDQALIMGVHTNMCILNRSFGIKQMVRWGVDIALVRDLTDAMYNPAMSPYVSHSEGTQLVVAYIERFWCPSVLSGALL
jgi:nicotinamidase-related amidase